MADRSDDAQVRPHDAEGTIQRYFKAPGESVNAGEPLYEVETEKVLYEVEAPALGMLAAALFPEGATVECGD